MLLKNNSVRVIGLNEKVILMPGVNNVPDDVWASLKEDKIIQAKVEKEELEVLSMKKDDGVLSLVAMPSKKAEKLVKETVDRDLLKSWKDKEKRQAIIDAIDAQLIEIADVKFHGDTESEEENKEE